MEIGVVSQLYEELGRNRPELQSAMEDAIEEYAEKKGDWVRGDHAGSDLLPSHEEFVDYCGDRAGQVFGLLLRNYLTQRGWTHIRSEDNGKPVAWYKR